MLALFGGKPVRSKPFPAWPIFGKVEEDRLLATLRSGMWGKLDGAQVTEFEEEFAAMHGCKHGIGVVNGTVSLRIALVAAGIGAEDEVIIPLHLFLHRLGRHRSQRHPRLRRYRSRHLQHRPAPIRHHAPHPRHHPRPLRQIAAWMPSWRLPRSTTSPSSKTPLTLTPLR
jgi:hypothetical protein